MILVYAMGGGLGHLSRCLAFVHGQSWESRDLHVLSPSPRAAEVFPEARILRPPASGDPAVLRTFFQGLLERYTYRELVIDAFPGGILGELPEKMVPRLTYLARHLKWSAYRERLQAKLPLYDRMYICEELNPEQVRSVPVKKSEQISLAWPDRPAPFALPENCWLIVHAGEEDEVRALYRQALDLAAREQSSPHLMILANPELLPESFPQAELRTGFPAWPLFAQAARVLSGAGFNTLQQMRGMEDKHVVLPFYRKLDDQGLRLSRMRADRQ